MANFLQDRFNKAKESLAAKKHVGGWVLPKESSSFSPEGSWSNIDLDVVVPERRTWSSKTIVGYWISDILSIQSWEIASTVIAVGLTWREALLGLIFGSCIMAIPMAFNGVPGAYLHVPFPVIARSSFGFYFSRFAIIVRMVSALFWHAIQTYAGATALTQMIRAIWPSYLDIPDTIPASVGVTSQELVSHFLFWSIQFPFLMVAPHKLRWFFLLKTVVVTAAAVGTTIGLCVLAHGSGDIWKQEPTVHGSTRSWLIVYAITSNTGSWSTVGTNISDFSRYLKEPRHVWTQCFWFPFICVLIGVLGIISTSASKQLYGEYIWDPIVIASNWTSPGGRAAAFFCGFAWVIAQIGVNVSANVISCSHDLMSLFPKYLNLRRSAILITITAGWIMVPWKIVHSASSLLSFMASLGIFLSPIMAITISDYWMVKKRAIDIPALYRPHERYRYNKFGINWRAAVALLVSIGPNLPGMINSVNPSIDIGGAMYISYMVWFYGFLSAFVAHVGLSLAFPDPKALLARTIYSDQGPEEVDGIDGGSILEKETVEEIVKEQGL